MAALKHPQNDCDSMHLCQPVLGDWFKRNMLDSVHCERMKPADQKKGAQRRSERCVVSVKTKLHARKLVQIASSSCFLPGHHSPNVQSESLIFILPGKAKVVIYHPTSWWRCVITEGQAV